MFLKPLYSILSRTSSSTINLWKADNRDEKTKEPNDRCTEVESVDEIDQAKGMP